MFVFTKIETEHMVVDGGSNENAIQILKNLMIKKIIGFQKKT